MCAGRRAVLTTALWLGSCAAGATAADAASVVVLPATPAAGTSAVVLGSGFTPRRGAAVRLGSARVAGMRTDARGQLETTLRVPARWRSGRRMLVVRAGRRHVAVAVSVVRRPGSTTSALAGLDGGERFVLATTRAPAGAHVRIRGSGLHRRVRISARLGGVAAGSARADRRGRLRLRLTVPAVPVGVRQLALRGRGVRLRLRFTVLASAASLQPAGPPTPPPPPPPGPPPVVAAAGDIACAPSDSSFHSGNGTAIACRQAATAAVLGTLSPDAVLPLGDTQYQPTAAAYAASYQPSWGRFDAIAHPVPGDEEYVTPGAASYFAYFGARAGDPALGYYSFDLGSWHVIALNSATCGVSCSGSAQESWLRADLAAHPTQCTLAYWHSPRFTSGTPSQATNTRPFWEDLYAAGAELVLGGNSHTYERFAPQSPAGVADATRGIREFVVGTGGKDHQEFATIRPNSEHRNNTTFGVLALTLRPTGYDWRFVPESGGGFTDSGSGDCH